MSNAFFDTYIRTASQVISTLKSLEPSFLKAVDLLEKSVRAGGTVYACGNGGSAAEAIHFVEELVARYKRDRPGIRAQHFCDGAVLTCWANDYEFDSVFERQAKTFLTEKDVLVVLSTSGNSKNVVRAVDAAIKISCPTIGLLGNKGGELGKKVTLPLTVDSTVTSHIQEAHLALIHMMCDLLEQRLFAEK